MPRRDIDKLIATLQAKHPLLWVGRPRSGKAGPHDSLWFFTHPASQSEVLVESSTGQLPFLIESDPNQKLLWATTMTEAASFIESCLALPTDPP